ncbi:MAG: hypothetical protein NC318_01785 [Blautia sp.]|nr:hypothetical protein [Lachnoclostridium sp.]MCM1210311.1 hypothetical protein [Blautia sp.]
MNKIIAGIGALIVTISVLLFAICMLVSFSFGSYFVCMLLPIGYIMMTAGFCNESDEEHRVAANVGMIFAAVYTVLVFLVYFAQTTSVRLDSLDEQAMGMLDYARGGLFFNYDLLGYGMLALSTFFIGLTIDTKTKADKWLKYLMLVHGVFFFSCFILPMTGIFNAMSDGETNMGGVIALEFWCVYFTPIGILSLIHFRKSNQ